MREKQRSIRKFFEKATGVMTEYNESGLSVPKEAVGRLLPMVNVTEVSAIEEIV